MLNTNEVLETYERLKVYPNLLEKVKEMLDLIEKELVKSVDDFEEALIPHVNKLGGEITQTWTSNEKKLLRKKWKQKERSLIQKKTQMANNLRKNRNFRTNFF